MTSDRLPPWFPQFDDVADERRHRKQRLAAAFRLFGQFGFDEGVAGHITARDPELLDHFWVNPLGMNFKQIRVKDLILVNDRGEVVDGNWPVNAAAFAIHSQVHAARPDVVAAAHAHSLYGKAWSSLRRPLDPLTQDACAFYGDHAVFDDYTGVVLRRADIRRRGGMVVHHDGTHLPSTVACRGGGHAGPDRSRSGGEDRGTGREPHGLMAAVPTALRLDRVVSARPPRRVNSQRRGAAAQVSCAVRAGAQRPAPQAQERH